MKQAVIHIASSERDALAKRAEALKEARKEAQGYLENLQGGQGVKVGDNIF